MPRGTFGLYLYLVYVSKVVLYFLNFISSLIPPYNMKNMNISFMIVMTGQLVHLD